MQLGIKKSKGISGAVLRVLAMTTMVIDHAAVIFLKEPMILTWIGRIAFPLYAFMLAEGFLIIHNDKERLKKHFTMLIILAVISEVGYDVMLCRFNFSEYLDSQSNMCTLLMGYLGMMATEWFFPSSASEEEASDRKKTFVLFCIYGLLGFSNYMIRGNFNMAGPWLVIAFYWYVRRSRHALSSGCSWSWAKRFLMILSLFICYLLIYFWVRSGFSGPARWWMEVVDYAPWVAGHFLAVVIISFYNGERGYHEKWFRKLYLSFYPLHMFAIALISALIGN